MSETQKPNYIEVQRTGERRDWKDVLRSFDVSFIGDLNGSFHAFLKNLLALGYIEVSHKNTGAPGDIESCDDTEFSKLSHFLSEHTIRWTGKDVRLIFLGDILGDRYGRGNIIIAAIETLQKQAEQEGGEIVTLLGNHDVAAILTLATGNSLAGNLNLHQCPLEEYELFFDTTEQLTVGRETIEYQTFLKKDMYEDSYIVNHIKTIQKIYSVATIKDDSLFFHSDILEDQFMAQYITIEKFLQSINPGRKVGPQDVIRQLNSQFHDAFEAAFPIENNTIQIDQQNTRPLEELFTSPNSFIYHIVGKDGSNRQTRKGGYSQKFKDFLSTRGVNAFFHGHSHRVDAAPAVQDDFVTFSVDGLTNRLDLRDQNYSVGTIHQNGCVETYIGQQRNNYRTQTQNI